MIGIAGGSGSGKSTLVGRLVEELGPARVLVLAHDAYYRDRPDLDAESRRAQNYDHPSALETDLLVEQLDRLVSGLPVEVPSYDFVRHARRAVPRRVVPRPVILVEGILCLVEPELRARMDLAIFLDADDATRFSRRVRRDVVQRGRSADSVARQYRETVEPMHRRFVEPSRRRADLVLSGQGDPGVAADAVLTRIRSLLGNTSAT